MQLFTVGGDHSIPGREKLDRYYTPMTVARDLVAHLPPIEGPVLEAHVGDGAWVRALSSDCVFVGDIDPEARGLELGTVAYVGDFLEHDGDYQAIIGNPPYDAAEAHVRHALALTRKNVRQGVVAFLLRISFLGSQGRAALFRDFPPAKIVILSKRPSFTGKGTDASDYAFIIWDDTNRGCGRPVLEWC